MTPATTRRRREARDAIRATARLRPHLTLTAAAKDAVLAAVLIGKGVLTSAAATDIAALAAAAGATWHLDRPK